MTNDPQLFTRSTFAVASWDVDARGRMTTAAMGRGMQEAAGENAARLGAGFDDLLAVGQTWVLSALLLRIERAPRFGEIVTVATWPRTIERRRALRDFRLLDADGEVFATAASAWWCLDLASRRPVAPDRWRTVDWLDAERATDRDPDRLPALDGDLVADVAVPVRWSDLDLNGHVTNTRYQDLLLESYPADWLRERSIAEVEINFLAEGRYPDTLHSRRRADPDAPEAWRHDLIRASDGKDICRARVVWR